MELLLLLVQEFIYELDQVLGFIQVLYEKYLAKLAEVSADPEVKKLVDQRAEFKKAKDYAQADLIRAQLNERGISISDMEGDQYLLRLSYL